MLLFSRSPLVWPAFAALFGVPWLVLGAATLLFAAWPALSEAAAGPLLVLSGLLFGMPHGACDVAAWSQATGRSWRAGRGVGALYLGLAAVTLGLWWIEASLALLAFLAITLWHWGEGDVWFALQARGARTLGALARGSLILAAPLALQVAPSREILLHLAELSPAMPDSAARIEPLFTFAPTLVVLALLAHPLALWLEWRESERRESERRENERRESERRENERRESERRDWAPVLLAWGALEPLLIVAFWSVTAPLAGVAIYLCGVHSWRHLVRLQTRGGREFGDASSLLRGIAAWHGAALWPSFLALVGLVPVFVLWPQLLVSAAGASASYLVLIAALTTPHAAFVIWLTQRKRA